MGKFTVDRFGQSGPAHSPLYEVPFQVKNATHLLYRYETDRQEVDDILSVPSKVRTLCSNTS
jgi:hypothetical protein